MKYLFFDMECCDGNHACSFGYVLCAADFSVLKKEDVLINPQKPFRLGRRGTPQIELGYPEIEFYKQKEFTHFYKKIKSLICAADTLPIGHATENDANFLNIACERYNLPFIDFEYLDTQELYRLIRGEKSNVALEKIAASLDLTVSNLHRSDEDAYLTMQVAKKLSREVGLKPEQFGERYKSARGFNAYGKSYGYKRLYKELMRVSVFPVEEKRNGVSDKRVYFTKKLDNDCIERIFGLVAETEKRGGRYTELMQNADIVVRADGERVKLYKPREGRARRVKVLTVAEYAGLLGISECDIPMPKLEDVDFKPLASSREYYAEKRRLKTSVKEVIDSKNRAQEKSARNRSANNRSSDNNSAKKNYGSKNVKSNPKSNRLITDIKERLR